MDLLDFVVSVFPVTIKFKGVDLVEFDLVSELVGTFAASLLQKLRSDFEDEVLHDLRGYWHLNPRVIHCGHP